MPAICKGCGQPVLWAVAQGGKPIPLDPTPNPQGTIALTGDTRITDDGRRGKACITVGPPGSLPDNRTRHMPHRHAVNGHTKPVPVTPTEPPTPKTARDIYNEQLPKPGTQRARILQTIAKRAERGATDDELMVRLNLSHQSCGPRRIELQQGGWIEPSGEQRPTRTGRRATVWVLSTEGRARYRHK